MTQTKDINILLKKRGFLKFFNMLLVSKDNDYQELQKQIADTIEEYKAHQEEHVNKYPQNFAEERLMKITYNIVNALYNYIDERSLKTTQQEERKILFKRIRNLVINFKDVDLEQLKSMDQIPTDRLIIIKSLELKNWMQFRDEKIDFVDIPDENARIDFNKNIFVIMAPNTSGKSAIFNAIKFCLFGGEARSKMAKYVNKDTVQQKFEEIKRTGSVNAQDPVVMEICLRLLVSKNRSKILNRNELTIKDFQELEVKRQWKFNFSLNKDTIKMLNEDSHAEYIKYFNCFDGGEPIITRIEVPLGSIDEDSFKRVFLSKFYPDKLKDLFISNSIELEKNLLQETNQYIRELSLKATDFSRLEEINKYINIVKKEIDDRYKTFRRENRLDYNEELYKNLRTEINRLSRQIETRKEQIQKTDKSIHDLNEEIEALRLKIQHLNEEDYDTFIKIDEDFNEKKNALQSIKKSLNRKIRAYVLKAIFVKIIDKDSIKDALSAEAGTLESTDKYEDYKYLNDYAGLLDKILNDKKCICGAPLNKETIERFEKIKNIHLIEGMNQKHNDLKNNIHILDQDYIDQIKEIIRLKKQYDQITKDFITVQKTYDLYQKGKQKNIKTIIRTIRTKEHEIEKKKQRMDKLSEEIEKFEKEIRDKEVQSEQINSETLEDDIIRQNDEFIYLQFITKYILKDSLKVLKSLYEKYIIKNIQSLITEFFKKVEWDRDFWSGLEINDDWKIMLKDIRKNKYDLPSDAQKKIIMISLICALATIRVHKITWVIDNAPSKISGDNLKGLARLMLDNSSFPLQIFFLTDDEYDTLKPLIASKLRKVITLRKTSASESKIEEVQI